VADEETALAKPVLLRPTLVSRLGLGLLLAPIVAATAAAGAWLVVGAIGAGFAATSFGISRRRIIVDDHGIRVRTLFGDWTMRWSDVTHYTYWSGPVRATIRGSGIERQIDGPHGGVSQCHHTLTIHGRNARIRISSAFRGADRGVARIVAELHTRFAGMTSFGPFTIEDDGLRHARTGFLPWPQIEVVRLREYPARLQVMKHDKAFPWQTASLTKLPNGILFLERLGERGVPVDLGTKQLVTPTLIETCGRHAGLPRAEIHRRR